MPESEESDPLMQQAGSGLLNKQIAAELNITEFTLKMHRGHAMADLVRMADQLGSSTPKRFT